MNIYRELRESLTEIVGKCVGVDPKLVPLVRRNKSLHQGDWVVPLPGLARIQPADRDSAVRQPPEDRDAQLKQMVSALQKCDWSAYVNRVQVENDKLFIFLDRAMVISSILRAMCREDDELKCHLQRQEKTKGVAFINHLPSHYVRSALLSQHITRLMLVNGYDVQGMEYELSEEVADLYRLYHVEMGEYHHQRSAGQRDEDWQRLCDRLQTSPYCTPSSDQKEVTLHLNSFIADAKLRIGRRGYDKNISQLTLNKDDTRCQQLLALRNTGTVWDRKTDAVCVHIIPRGREFRQQQIDIAWRITEPDSAHIRQVHQVHGSVMVKDMDDVPAKELFRMRWQEMKQAFVMKYGQETVQGAGWEWTISQVTAARIKFEILTTSCQSQVALTQAVPGGAVDSCGGVFVMYNCARLATLLHNYQQAVQQGTYPSLPSVDEVDFSLLRDEMEWQLVYNYVVFYPDVIRDTLDLDKDTIHTHKICHFLQDLCRDLSSYYSKTHVLQEGRPHMLPVMFARLHLLKALQQILHHALYLLNIQPVTQL